MNHFTTGGANRLFALLMLVVLLAASCSAQEQPDGSASAATNRKAALEDRSGEVAAAAADSEAATPAVEVPVETDSSHAGAAAIFGGGVVLEAIDMVVGPTGVQMRVEAIDQRADATFVRLAIVNGSSDEKQVPHQEVATLTLADGTTLEPVAAFPNRGVPLEAGDSSVVVLVFPPTSGAFDLIVGVDGLLTSPFSRHVAFAFDDLDPANVVVGLQPDAPLAAVGTHPNGTQIELDGIRFRSDRMGVGIEVRNGSTTNLWLFGSAETFVEDNLGNRYRSLVEPNGDTFFELAPESSLTGVLTFAGRMDPRATSYSIFVNDGGLLTNAEAKDPAFVLGPFTVGAEQAINVPIDAETDITIDQINGSTATLSAFRFDEDSIRAHVSIINESEENVDFNGGLTYVVDSEGITYDLQIEELPELALNPGEGFEGELVFSGRLQPDATSVRLTINHGGLRHSFFFEPVEITRSTTVAAPPTFEVTDTSLFSIAALGTSSVTEIAGAIAQFDGVEVDGGVLLTLPEAILFDFGTSTLRPDAVESIRLVAEILDFYEGDPVVVVGHTDSVGSDASNLDLSVARANAVLDALVSEGIDLDLLAIDGRGESEPVVANEQVDGSDDPAGRQLNRRVEIFIQTTLGIPQS